MDILFYFLPVAALAMVMFLFWEYYRKTERKLSELNQKLHESEQQLKIAEENFYTRKMGQQVFEKILHYYKAQMVDFELKISKLQNSQPVDISEKLRVLGSKIKHPTKGKIHRLEKLLKEAEELVAELNFLQNKLLKHEIDEELFNYLSEEKHKKIIEAESSIRKLTKPKEPIQEIKAKPKKDSPQTEQAP